MHCHHRRHVWSLHPGLRSPQPCTACTAPRLFIAYGWHDKVSQIATLLKITEMYPLTVLGTRRLKIKGSGFHVPSATPFCFVAAGICGIPWLTAVSLQPRLLSSHGLPPCVSLASPSLLCVSVSVSKCPSPYKDTRPWIRAQLDYISKDSVPNKITVTGIGDEKVTIAFWGGHNSTHNIHRVCFFPSNSFSYHSVAQKSSCLWEKFGLL